MGNCYGCKHFLRTPFCAACKYQNCKTIKDMKPECPYFKRSFWDKILFDNKEKDIVYSANILGKGGITVEQKLKAIEKCIDKYMRNTCRNCTYKKRTGCDKNVCFENQVKILEIIKGTSL